ncbi:Elongation factor Ts [bioreactor metagenome]|uniref:Elongation factor Ts n=1 Tax=bioreactor metagenome TaxID=1076179 RepID=A0A645BG83_9ZZZZ|nr:translation elongation factor Ts [Lachnospiraceae bacterium]
MAITAALVKELREISGAGMLDCKKALMETNGNIEKAVEYLREKGLAASAKKAGRIASEGIVDIFVSDDNQVSAIVEVNSETDFVAKNQMFKNYVAAVAKQAAETTSEDIEAFLKDKWSLDSALTVEEALSQQVAVIGENLKIRRFSKFIKEDTGVIVPYIHGGGRIGTMVELKCDKPCDALVEAGKNVAMQVAALNAKFIAQEDVPSEFIEKEREILKHQALNDEKNAGKPENIIDKMIEGRLKKELKEYCLLEQAYVKDGDMTVASYLASVAKGIGVPIKVTRFERFETGEGLAKKEENFADEVAKAMK